MTVEKHRASSEHFDHVEALLVVQNAFVADEDPCMWWESLTNCLATYCSANAIQ